MTKPTILIVDAKSGTETVREMNNAEFAQYEADQAEAQAQISKAELKAQAKAAAEGKLAALGLTTDDLRALGL